MAFYVAERAETYSIYAWDYINWRIFQTKYMSPDENYFWHCPELPDPDEYCLDFRALSYSFEKLHAQTLKEMVELLNMNPCTCYNSEFIPIANTLFVDGIINWGRIFALFAFCGAVALYCLEKGYILSVIWITEFLSWYCLMFLADWIEEHLTGLNDYALIMYSSLIRSK